MFDRIPAQIHVFYIPECHSAIIFATLLLSLHLSKVVEIEPNSYLFFVTKFVIEIMVHLQILG